MNEATDPVTRATFDAAVIAGDLETIEAFLAQRHIRNEIEQTNAFIRETLSAGAANDDDAATFTLRDGSCPWFRRLRMSTTDLHDVPLLSAARNGHVHVVKWFFSRERASFMGATLALLLPLVIRFKGRHLWFKTNWESDSLVVDALLESHVFRDWIADDRKQLLLDKTAKSCQQFQLANVLIAHGARVNETISTALLVGGDLIEPPVEDSQNGLAGDDANSVCWAR